MDDLTRDPMAFPAGRDLRLQSLARGDEGFLLALGYSTQRGYGRTHPFAGEIRMGEVEVCFVHAGELGFDVPLGTITGDRVRDGEPIQGQVKGPTSVHARLRPRIRTERAQGDVDGFRRSRSRARELGEEMDGACAGRGVCAAHSDNVQATGFVEHLKLPHYVDFQAELALLRQLQGQWHADREAAEREAKLPDRRGGRMTAHSSYNFAYLDEQTKRMIRRALLKAIAIPGYQVPFSEP